MERYNEAMSAVRMSVEWLFGNMVKFSNFSILRKTSEVLLVQLQKCTLCAILRNAKTCMYTNSRSEQFALESPTIEDYF